LEIKISELFGIVVPRVLVANSTIGARVESFCSLNLYDVSACIYRELSLSCLNDTTGGFLI
jgi:hypothetical protein